VEVYADLLGRQMFSVVAQAVVMEPKWMVGMEWDVIALLRDIYCRMVLGQSLLPGGQGPGMQQPRDGNRFTQARNAADPLSGGGISVVVAQGPREILAGLPGVGPAAVVELDRAMTEKAASKDQKDVLRDLLRVAAEHVKSAEGDGAHGLLGRAVAEESLLNQSHAVAIPDIPETLVTSTQVAREQARDLRDGADVSDGSLAGMFAS